MAAYTAGFMIHVTCRLTAKNRDQLRNPTLGNRVRAVFTFLFLVTLCLGRTADKQLKSVELMYITNVNNNGTSN